MRCRQVRQKLIQLSGSVSEADHDLREHLQSCSKCASFARAELELKHDLDLASADDKHERQSWTELIAVVEKRAVSMTPKKSREKSIMSILTNQFRKRPKLGFSVALAVILLVLATTVPFKFDKTLGYEVAIAGVDENLAVDNEKLEILLETIGLEDAKFTVDGCEVTCNIVISDLKSEDDVEIVKIAFEKMGNCVVEDVLKITSEVSSSIAGVLNVEISGDDAESTVIDFNNGGDVTTIVINLLDSLVEFTTDNFSIWISEDEDNSSITLGMGDEVFEFDENSFEDMATLSEKLEPISGNLNIVFDQIDKSDSFVEDIFSLSDVISIDEDGSITINADQASINQDGISLEILIDKDETMTYIVHTPDGNVHRIDALDEDAYERLEALGVEVDYGHGNVIIQDDCGGKFGHRNDSETTVSNSIGEDEDSEISQKVVPEGYDLGQNYPNPFNPETEISYSIPESEHVIIEVYNMAGQKVTTLVDDYQSAGSYSVNWNSTDKHGNPVASGMYMYVLKAGDVSMSKKMSLVK